jgi:endogenous inhibitor of DNA gyrase (YacG/DUF329 family)
MPREVACPRCGQREAWEGNRWRPFCSERCKLIDFGDWLEVRHKIPGDPVETAEDDESKH